MVRRLLSLYLLAALGALAQTEAPLFEIKLKNGDRLTGEIVEEGTGKLLLRSSIYGDLAIPEDQIASKHTLGKPALAEAESPKLPPPADAATPTAAPVQPPVPAPAAPVVAKEQPQWKKVLRGTKGSVEFGYRDEFGRVESKSTSLIMDAEYTTGPNNYKLSGRYYYSEYSGTTQSDRSEGAFRYRHDLSPIYFLQSHTSYTRDRVKAINMNIEQSAGLGWAAVKTKRHKLNVGAGALAQSREINQVGQGTSGFFDFFEDYLFQINDRINFKQDSTAQYSPIDRAQYTLINGQLVPANDTAANFQVRFNATLQGKLTHRITLNLRYEYEYDNTIIDQKLKSDKRITTTIGYTF